MQIKLSPSQVQDSGKVRMGSLSPSFPAARTQAPDTADKGKVRMGSLSPSFPAARSADQAGFPRNDDFNGPTQEGIGYFQMTSRKGLLCSTAVGYLRPARKRQRRRTTARSAWVA